MLQVLWQTSKLAKYQAQQWRPYEMADTNLRNFCLNLTTKVSVITLYEHINSHDSASQTIDEYV